MGDTSETIKIELGDGDISVGVAMALHDMRRDASALSDLLNILNNEHDVFMYDAGGFWDVRFFRPRDETGERHQFHKTTFATFGQAISFVLAHLLLKGAAVSKDDLPVYGVDLWADDDDEGEEL